MKEDKTTLTESEIHATADFWVNKTHGSCTQRSLQAHLFPGRLLQDKNFAGECYEWAREQNDDKFRASFMVFEQTVWKDCPKALHRLGRACGMKGGIEEEVS